MNMWIIAGIVVLLVFGGVAVVNAFTDTEQELDTASCTSCGNSCTAEINCGLAGCGAVSGGSCGCGR